MLRRKKLSVVLSALLGISAAPLTALAHECPPGLPDEPAISNHLEQSDIVSGALRFEEISSSDPIYVRSV